MFRIGHSRDIHRLEENGKPFVVGGVKIPFHKGNVAHSDGDVLYHALAEALLGALALGDLGKHFPDTSDEYLDIDSSILVKRVYSLIKDKGYKIVNVDSSVITELPRLSPYIDKMRENIATILETDIDNISVNAQTNERIGEIGSNNAIEAFATVLLERKEK